MGMTTKTIIKTIQSHATYGVRKDATIMEDAPTHNTGINTTIEVMGFGSEAPGDLNRHIVMEVLMPDEKFLPGFDRLLKVELGLYAYSIPVVSYNYVAVVKDLEDFDEGTQWDSDGYCNWVYSQPGIAWHRGSGGMESEQGDIEDSEIQLFIDSVICYNGLVNSFIYWDITTIADVDSLIRFLLFVIERHGTPTVSFRSKEYGTVAQRPVIRITYLGVSPEGLEGDEDLSIEPYDLDPTKPKLKWGAVSGEYFSAYKIYRDTSPISDVSLMTPIATITNPTITEFVDDTLAHLENTDYYYVLIAEGSEHTGNDGTWSSNVSFIRPTCTHSEPSDTHDVGDLITITLNSAIKCKRAYVDWGDSLEGYWIEAEVETTQFVLEHRYSEHGSQAIKARLESSAGYWSDLDTVCTKTINDTSPSAILIARPLEFIAGEVVRLNGILSQPVSSSATITHFKFYYHARWPIAHALAGGPGSGAFYLTGKWLNWSWNDPFTVIGGPNAGSYTIAAVLYIAGSNETQVVPQQAVPSTTGAVGELEHGPGYSDAGTRPIIDIMPYGTQDVKLQVQTSSGRQKTTDDVTITEFSGDPVELTFSRHTVISSRGEERGTLHSTETIEGGSGEVEVRYGSKNPALRFDGMSTRDEMKTDLDKIRTAIDEDTYVRILAIDEEDGKTYAYDGKVRSASIGKSHLDLATWNFLMSVYSKTEV